MTHPSVASDFPRMQETRSAAVTTRVDLLGPGGEVELSWGLGIGRWSLGSGPQNDVRISDDASIAPCHIQLTVGKRYTLLKAVGPIRIAGRPIREWLIDQSTLVECGDRWLVIHPNKQTSMAVVTHDRLSEIAERLATLNIPLSSPNVTQPARDPEAIVEEFRNEVIQDLSALRDTVNAIHARIDELPDMNGLENRLEQKTTEALLALQDSLPRTIGDPIREEMTSLASSQQSRWEESFAEQQQQFEASIHAAASGFDQSLRSTNEVIERFQSNLEALAEDQGDLRALFSRLETSQAESNAAIERLSIAPPQAAMPQWTHDRNASVTIEPESSEVLYESEDFSPHVSERASSPDTVAPDREASKFAQSEPITSHFTALSEADLDDAVSDDESSNNAVSEYLGAEVLTPEIVSPDSVAPEYVVPEYVQSSEYVHASLPTEISSPPVADDSDEVFEFQVDDESISQRLSRMLSDPLERRSTPARSKLSAELERSSSVPSAQRSEQYVPFGEELDPEAIYTALSELNTSKIGLTPSAEDGVQETQKPLLESQPASIEEEPEFDGEQQENSDTSELSLSIPYPVVEQDRFESQQEEDVVEEQDFSDVPAAESPQQISAALLTAGDTSDEGSGEEDSIEQYMQRLLQRVRTGAGAGDSSGIVAVDSVKQPPEPIERVSGTRAASGILSGVAGGGSGISTSSRNRLAADGLNPPSTRTRNEVKSDIEALREIANSNARRAINRSVIRRKSSNVIIKGAVVVISLVCAIAMFLMNGFRVSATLGGFVIALVIAVLWGIDTAREAISLIDEKKQREADNQSDLSESLTNSGESTHESGNE